MCSARGGKRRIKMEEPLNIKNFLEFIVISFFVVLMSISEFGLNLEMSLGVDNYQ